jgi:hypothetical protein
LYSSLFSKVKHTSTLFDLHNKYIALENVIFQPIIHSSNPNTGTAGFQAASIIMSAIYPAIFASATTMYRRIAKPIHQPP